MPLILAAGLALAASPCGDRCPARTLVFRNSFLAGSTANEAANLFVTFGELRENNMGDAIAIATRASSGQPLWTHRSTGIQDDRFAAATIDSRLGRVYLTGYRAPLRAEFPLSDFFQLTVALDAASGALLWSHTTETPGYADSGHRVFAAPDGAAVYVVGNASRHIGVINPVTGHQETDIRVVKLDARTGRQIWIHHQTGSWTQEVGQDSALSPDGRRLVVVGERYEPFEDAMDLMLDTATGVPVWKRASGDASANDLSTAVGFSADSKTAYIAHARQQVNGSVQTLGDFVVNLAAYEVASGRRLWQRTLSRSGAHLQASDLALNAGGPCVTGTALGRSDTNSAPIRSGFAACLTNTGALRWASIPAPDTRAAERNSIAADSTIVVVSGSERAGAGQRAIRTEVRSATTGALLWTGLFAADDAQFGGTGGEAVFLWRSSVVTSGHALRYPRTEKVILTYPR